MSRTQRLRITLFEQNLYPGIICAVFLILMAAIFLSVPIIRVRGAGNPSVIVNKYFNSGTTADVVELLVIQDALDMRGMIIKDFSSSMGSDGGGKYTFSNDALWSSVRSGTLIVLRNDNSAVDVTVGGADYNLDLGMQNATYFASSGTFDIATTEMVMIKAAGSGTAGVTGSIHVLAGGTAGAQFTATAVPKLIASGTSAGGTFVFANNTTQSINDFDGTDATGAATGLTFGSGNNANNTAYINSLRTAASPTPSVSPTPTPTPSLSINDVSQAEGNSGSSSFTFTVSLSQPAPVGGVTFNVDTADGTATIADNDYVAVHTTGVTIAAGLSSTPVAVQINGDTTTEANETFFVNISSVTNAGVTDAQGQGTIVNDDGVASSGVVISQVYGGGGNSGATYRNDFIELYNRGTTPVDLTGWSVQFTAVTDSFAATSPTTGTPLVTNLSGIIQPGHYYLIQEAAGANVTTSVLLPTPDATGSIAVGSTGGKVALVSNTTVLSGTCPAFLANGIVDFIGYGAANCSETSPTAGTTSLVAAIRKNNGCTDTDNNSADFSVSGGPIPRNSSTTNTCAGSGALSASGSANPNSVDPGVSTLLTVAVSPASGPTSTGITVTGNLTNIGGSATQPFYDDGTHGDVTIGDNVFSFSATTSSSTSAGAKSLPISVADAQARNASAFITMTIALPTCGVERWSVKVGTDPDASLCDLTKATPVTLATMRGWPAPASPPLNARVAPYETTVWVVNGTLIDYKKESDVDYHLVLQDGAGTTIVTEIPCPCCGVGSPFQSMMANARSTFDARLTATTSFQNPNIPVRLTGVGFFDFLHGQTGVAPNGIEVHSILSIAFPTSQNAATTVGLNTTTTAGDATIRFSDVTAPGTTTVNPIDPSTSGPALAGYSLVGPAFNITTTATSTGPYNVCINVPYITDSAAFSNLKLLHNEGGVLVDRTTGENFTSKIVCGSAPTLSPFVVALGNTPTAANSVISGRLSDPNGIGIAGAVVNLSGTQNRKFITDANGDYHFDNVETNGFYTVKPTRANYSFSPVERSFSQLGNSTEAEFTGSAVAIGVNPLDTPEYFVRQHYLDFLSREPDEIGFNFWSEQMLSCGSDANCLERRLINVSAAYFLSIEFQNTGGLVDGLYRASYGRPPRYDEFMPDTQMVAKDLVVGRNGWEQRLDSNKLAFVDGWVQRPAFHAVYDLLTNDRYVDSLIAHTGVSFTQSERDSLVLALSLGTVTRAGVLQRVVEDDRFVRAKSNETFVMMEYFGYLRRDPDQSGYQFWLNKLNQFGGNFEQAEMVKAFINSGEYRARFAQ